MISLGSLCSGRGLFVVLGLADLLLTCYLLAAAPADFYESNPLARWWFDRWGWAGLAGFKAATVLFALAAIGVVARRRPRVAGWVLGFACVATALVVAYSCALAFATRGLPQAEALAEQGRQIDEQLRPLREYCRVMSRLGDDLRAGRRSVAEAVVRLAETEQARNPDWLAALRQNFPGRSDADSMAALLRDSLDSESPGGEFSAQTAPGAPPTAARREPELVGPLPAPLPG